MISILSETAGALRGNDQFLQRLNRMACIDGWRPDFCFTLCLSRRRGAGLVRTSTPRKLR